MKRGVTKKVPLKDIIVEGRIRKDLGDLTGLMKSIESNGLLNPIIVTKDLELIAGSRRYTCCKNLNFSEIEVTIYEDLSELSKRRIEYEENLHKSMEWWETVELRYLIHSLNVEEYGKAERCRPDGWTIEDTANSIGLTKGILSQDLNLYKAMQDLPELKKYGTRGQALSQLSKIEEILILKELAKRNEKNNPLSSILNEEKKPEAKVKKISSVEIPYKIIHGDAVEEVKKLPDGCIDLIIFDPPWGISIDEIGARSSTRDGANYDDSEEYAKDLATRLTPELYRVLKDDCHMFTFIGSQFIDFWKSLFRDLKFTYIREVPLVWVKESGGYTDQNYYFMPRHELFLHCTKGVRKLNEPSSDVFIYNRPANTERIHTQQKSIEFLQKLIKLTTVQGEVILDPTCGSGSTLKAASLIGRRSIGIENNEENYLKAKMYLEGRLDE